MSQTRTPAPGTAPAPAPEARAAHAAEPGWGPDPRLFHDEPLIFEFHSEGSRGVPLPPLDVPAAPLSSYLPPAALRATPPGIPDVGEATVVRHFTRISAMNHNIDQGFYPLGSCTMKYNPKINDELAALPGFQHLHPLTPPEGLQGALRLMHEISESLKEITGLDAVSLQPAAGAHGELLGLLLTRAYHESKGRPRRKVLVPDSAHGTNPASVALVGYEVVELKSCARGEVDLEALKAALDEDVAALMITNPNTLGLFERQIREVAELVHRAGALLYMDGANLNALVGLARPGDLGFDICHINLHKTFTQPHGGGGPGAGPIAVRAMLEPFLPVPWVAQQGDRYQVVGAADAPRSIGRIHGAFGQFGVFVRAYAYMRMLGREGLAAMSRRAILNANYLRAHLQRTYRLAYPFPCTHEFVLSGVEQKKKGVRVLDIAKRLLDFGVHAPTVYFPLIVEEAIMIEPTETEEKRTLDHFIAAMEQIAAEVERSPDTVHGAPYTTPVGRLDEGRAARELVLRWAGPAPPETARG
ncbi:MAG TPA: aminomethyl-transferring glycine dehydrogenase subunit GcvPB [Candidatus Saccharimonadales bacterium]|nr:aminomethyl-transferring glycine dehydrogenase subunit GcvPB [Candidatus Saccharimonadales bacterium]